MPWRGQASQVSLSCSETSLELERDTTLASEAVRRSAGNGRKEMGQTLPTAPSPTTTHLLLCVCVCVCSALQRVVLGVDAQGGKQEAGGPAKHEGAGEMGRRTWSVSRGEFGWVAGMSTHIVCILYGYQFCAGAVSGEGPAGGRGEQQQEA